MSEKETLSYSQYIQKYKTEHYDTIKIMVSKDRHLKADIKECAQRKGLSANAWLLQVVEEAIQKAHE